MVAMVGAGVGSRIRSVEVEVDMSVPVGFDPLACELPAPPSRDHHVEVLERCSESPELDMETRGTSVGMMPTEGGKLNKLLTDDPADTFLTATGRVSRWDSEVGAVELDR